MTVDDHDDSSLAQQNSALAMLRTGNVSLYFCAFISIFVWISIVTSCVSLCFNFHNETNV